MAKSEVYMYQPYALVVEVSKSFDDTSILKVMYDEKVFDLKTIEGIVSEVQNVVYSIIQRKRQDLVIQEL